MNTDGSAIENPGIAGCGGILRDEHGHLIKGFTRKIGITNSFVTELQGLRDGLLICSSCSFDCVEIELDAKAIIDVLANPNYVNNIVSPILDDCRQLISSLIQVRSRHCYRKANNCADKLAKMGSSHNLDFAIFDNPPMDLLSVYEDDLNGMYFNRLCLDTSALFQFYAIIC